MGVKVGSDEARLVHEWRTLLTEHARIWSELDRRLHAEHGLTASAFEVLDRLVECPRGKLRAQELIDVIHLSQSASSRLVAQMEKDGLVERGVCDVDRRGVYVCVTDAGRRRHRQARPTHRAVLAAHCGAEVPASI